MFKVGDLVKMRATFHPERHPPIGTLGVVTEAEIWDFGEIIEDKREDIGPMHVEQFIRVCWAHPNNNKEQCYVNTSIEMVKAC